MTSGTLGRLQMRALLRLIASIYSLSAFMLLTLTLRGFHAPPFLFPLSSLPSP